MKTLLFIIILALPVTFSYGQTKPVSQEIERKNAKENEIRFTTDSLRNIYIPKDIEDCFKQINILWVDSTRNIVKQWTEDEFFGKVHHGFGMWIRNNWQLWGGSRLSKLFNEKGIYHADDMSGIILTSYHRYLSNKEIRLNEQIQYYKDYWENAKKQELKKKIEDFVEYKIGDTVLFNYKNGFVTKDQEKKYDDDKCTAKGKILSKNENDFTLKIILLESCDKKGIIYYDNENVMIYNKETQKLEKPKERIIENMQIGQTNWFNYKDWETD
jgi:hypothetical protein